MKYFYFLSILIFFTQCEQKQDYLIWSDEFDGEGLPDSDKWNIITGNGCPELCGFGNNEKQHYTSSTKNLYQQDGKLIIKATEDEEKGYTSARITSSDKASWKYAYIEVRAKLPRGKGTWPAIWMLPTLEGNMEWPKDGEIDIMEHVGYNQGTVYGTIHSKAYNHMKNTQKSDSVFIEDASKTFHTYAINWTEEKIEWFVDDVKYHTIFKEEDDHDAWPFTKKFHLILNLAVGGDWGGRMGIDRDIWPQSLEIDFVRVYSQKPLKN